MSKPSQGSSTSRPEQADCQMQIVTKGIATNGSRTLLGAPGLTTRSQKLLGAKGIATSNKGHRYERRKKLLVALQ